MLTLKNCPRARCRGPLLAPGLEPVSAEPLSWSALTIVCGPFSRDCACSWMS